jgi:hypothetical protein
MLSISNSKRLISGDSAFFLLHTEQGLYFEEAVLSLPPLRESNGWLGLSSADALKTTMRIVIDNAENFNDNVHRIRRTPLPPTYCAILYQAATTLLLFRGLSDQQQWESDLEILRETLWHFSHRWHIAGKSLHSYIEFF